MNEFLDPFNPAVRTCPESAKAFFLQQTGDPVASQQMAWRRLEKMRLEQASSLAYFDCFFLFGVLAAGLVFLVLFMKRSVAEKSAHLAPE